ncbi:hypothetical protein KF840_18820 [bacterium]|nr:hypothetical protein [bacterium]
MTAPTVALDFDAEALARAGLPALGRRYLLWRTFPPRKPGGKPVKSPCAPAGYPVTGHDERRWLDFERAAPLAQRCGYGLGVALGWGVGGLDLDRCRAEDGTLSDLARRLLGYFPTYVERSPSGTGCKAYFLAGPAFRVSAKDDERGVELYAGRRFFALTGAPLGELRPLADCTAAACTLAAVLRPPRPAPAYTGPPRPLGETASEVLARCDTVRERPSIHGGTVYTLRRCPWTGEEHDGGGPYAIAFPDGALRVCCERSSHGPRTAMLRGAGARR